MTIHAPHPDVHEHGLADGCERCAEHAAHPTLELDDDMIAKLHARVAAGLPGRSTNEWLAMMALRSTGRS